MLASRVTTANLETNFPIYSICRYFVFLQMFDWILRRFQQSVQQKMCICFGDSLQPFGAKKPLPSFSHLLGDVADVCGLYGILLVCRMDGLKTHHALMFFFWDVSTHIGERGNFELECTIQVPPRNHLKMLVGAQKCMYEFKQFHKQNAPSKKKSTWNFRSFS